MDRPPPPSDRWSVAPGALPPEASGFGSDLDVEAGPSPRLPRSPRARQGSIRADARRLDPRGVDLGRFELLRRRPSAPGAPRSYRIGSIRINPWILLISGAIVFAIFYISWAIFRVRDVSQIPMLSTGFAVLGLALAFTAVTAAVSMWRAASRARTGRALGLAIGGGLAGFAAIGCFTLTVLFALVWRS